LQPEPPLLFSFAHLPIRKRLLASHLASLSISRKGKVIGNLLWGLVNKLVPDRKNYRAIGASEQLVKT
jgi:hypothetical protein